MSEREQSIHLFIGDQYAAGLRPTAEAGDFNGPDTIRPSMRFLTGGTQDDIFKLPTPIVANEWSLEHLLGPIMDTATLSFVATLTQANAKVAVDDAGPQQLMVNGSIRDEVDTIIARVALETIFANMKPETLFLLNGDTSFDATGARVVAHGLRPGTRFETEGFTIQVDPTFASGDARDSLIVALDGTNDLRLTLSGGESRLEVQVGGSTDSSATFVHASGANMFIVVDWLRLRATVVLTETGEELVGVDLTNGNWDGLENTDATFGVFDGTVFAPNARPVYADPRVDLIVIQMGSSIGVAADAATEAAQYVNAITQMRTAAWGARALVWFILPPEDVPTAGDAIMGRTAMLQAAAALENVMAFEARQLDRATVSGDDVLTGASLITLATATERDWLGIISSNLRFLGRPPHTGFRRFQLAAEANAFIEELIDAGLTTREVSPHLGGPGARSGAGVDAPWARMQTTRVAGDYFTDPNTGELLVPIDRAAAAAGFGAPARGIRIVPSTAGTGVASATAVTLEGAALIDWADVTTTRASEGQLYDPLTGAAKYIDDDRALALAQTAGVLNELTPVVTWVDINDVTITASVANDPAGGADAVTLDDTNAGGTGNADTPDGASVSISDDVWVGLRIERDAASPNFCTVYAREAGAAVAGVHVDFATGQISDFGSPDATFIGRHGNWYFVAFRYKTTATTVSVGVRPSAGLTASFPSLTSQVGDVTVFGPIISNSTTLDDIQSNPTPYAYDAQPRLLATDNLMCEGQRINELTESVDLTAGVWVLDEGATLARGTRGPDGSPDSWVLTDATADPGLLQFSTASLTGGAYAMSVYVKQDLTAEHFAGMKFTQSGSAVSMTISLVDGSTSIFDESGFSGTTAYTETVTGPDGEVWFRVTMLLASLAASTGNLELYAAMSTVAGTLNAAATGSTEFSGPQLEVGKFASTYIPTAGGAGTRAVDDHIFVAAAVDAVFYSTGFAFDYYPEHASGADSQTSTIYLLGFTTGGATYHVRMVTPDGSTSQPEMRSGGAARSNGAVTFARGDKLTFAAVYGATLVVSKNGVAAITIDISADGDWSARSGDTSHVGADAAGASPAFGSFSPLRVS